MNQQRQTILVSQNLTLQEALEKAAQINEELKRTELAGAFCKKFKLLINRFSLFLEKIGREKDLSKEK